MSNPLVYVIEPFGCVRAYSETLTCNLAGEIPAKLLTTGLTQVRGPIDRGDHTVERFFLRLTARIKTSGFKAPSFLFKLLGLAEYCVDLFRLRRLRQEGVVFHWQWIPVPTLTLPLLWLFRVPIDVLTSHDLVLSGSDGITLSWASKASLKMAKRVIFHSAKLEAAAIALMPSLTGKTQVIPHGLLFELAAGRTNLIKDFKLQMT